MNNKNQFETRTPGPELTCSEFDALLSDAIDGSLSTLAQRRFDAHRQNCSTCGSLFSETSAGLNWLNMLEEVEPPANLVHNILAATTMRPAVAIATAPKSGWKERVSGLLADIVAPARALVRQPRLAMTGAMAVFSITLSLNLAGIKLNDLRHVDLRPSAIKETATMKYYETTSRVVKYYENIRLVYEYESRLQELKRAISPEEQEAPPVQHNKTDNERPDREQKQNYYSMQQQRVQLAKWSTQELKNSGNLKCFAGRNSTASNLNLNQTFATAELSRGLKPNKESGSVEVPSELGGEVTRSSIA